MKPKKEDFIVLFLAFTLILVVFGIAFLLYFAPSKKQSEIVPGNVPTVVPPTRAPTPTLSSIIINVGDAKILFNITDANILADLAENRRELSVEDIQVKQNVLEPLFAVQPSGYVYQSSTIGIKYINSQDQFEVEIRTPDITNAKKEAVDWFLSRGFTQDGLCKMPIRFTLNNIAAKSLEGTTLVFSPRVPECN